MKGKSIILTLLLFIAVSLTINAQYVVKCQVNDSQGEGEPFATVRIVHAGDTSKLVATGVTELDGSYSQSLTTAGDYLLRVSAVGKVEQEQGFSVGAGQTVADLGVITLATAENLLEGVTVTSQRQLVRNEIDRLSYDVQADADAKTKTAMDILRKVPMVSVDAQDNITVKGSSNFKIYKNGHPDAMLSSNPKEIFKAIPASMIKKIEVITEPGAKYDAEGVGAILNIVMVDGGSTNGVTGNVGVTVDNYGDINLNGFLTGQYNKFITSVNYGNYRVSKHRQHNFWESEHLYNNGNTQIANQESFGKGNIHFGNIEASYEPDTLNLLTFNFGGHYGAFSLDAYQRMAMTALDGSPIYKFNINTAMPDYGFFSFNGRFDYQHKTSCPDETLTLSYLLSTTRNTREGDNLYQDVEGMDLGYNQIYNNSHENFVEQTVQFDWARPFAVHNKVETGVKYINRGNRSRYNQDYFLADDLLAPMSTKSRLRHTTQVAAVYLSYTYTLDKWTARAGLRYEFSRLSAKFPDGEQADYHSNLNDWVPSASLNYQFDWANSLKFAFATRIARPGISYLNPAVKETPTSLSYGDAHLESARNYSLSLSYMHIGQKFTFNVSPSYGFSDNGIGAIQFVDDLGREVSTYANTLNSKQVALDGFIQWQPHEKTSLMFNGGVYHEWLKSKALDLKNDGTSRWFYCQLTQKLPWNLRLSANVGTWGGGIDGSLYEKSKGSWWHGFGLQRSFLKEERLTVGIHAQNPFGGKYSGYRSNTIQGDYTGSEYNRWVNRAVQISISYRFGSLNAQVKKTSTTIENNDVVGGVSQGTGQGGSQQGSR